MALWRTTNLRNGIANKLWRGKRAGRLVKEREVSRRNNIDLVQSTREFNRVWHTSNYVRAHNPGNCVNVPLTTPILQRNGSQTVYCPSLLLTNVMSLAPKIDELRHVVQHSNLDCICITETWLRSHISDNIINLEGFNLVRRDRHERIHGGVCMYILCWMI